MWEVLDRRKCPGLMMSRLLPLLLLPLLHMPGTSGSGLSQAMKTSYACQGDRLELQCHHGTVIKVMRANYGRFSVGICNEHGITDWSVNCMAPRSLRILQDRCNNQRHCDISAENSNFGSDPCPNVPKYLEVYFGCFDETSTSSTTTPNPLPPWLTTRSPLSFLPYNFHLNDFDINISPPHQRIPVTAPESTTSSTTTSTTTTTTITTTTATTTTTTARTTTTSRAVETTAPVSAEDDTQRLVYTSDSDSREVDTEVKIVSISTSAPPGPHPHTGTTQSPPLLCPPRHIRALSWGWTVPGDSPSQSCPTGTTGMARWTCRAGAAPGSAPAWHPSAPDLSDCQSVWMEKIISELRTSDLIINLANDLMQYVSVNALYGKDITSAIDAMTIIAEKMQYQLREIPTREQREAMVMELVQSLTKIGSFLLSSQNLPAWQDLPASLQTRFLTNFISALEKTGSLLPGVVETDQEVSMSSDNLLLTIRKISFSNIRGTQFPSRASLATQTWRDYSDTVNLPAQVLMENMQGEAAQVVFLGMKNMELLLEPGSESSEGRRQIVNSQVIHIALGSRPELRLSQPVDIMFRQRSEETGPSPTCVLWDGDTQAWSPSHCRAVFSNSTHCQCHCSRLGTAALLQDVLERDNLARTTFVVIVIVAVSVATIVLISLVLVVIYCYRIKVRKQLKIKLNKADLSCFKNKNKCWSLTESPTLNEDLFPADNSDSAYDIVRNSDFMVLSRAALAVHDSERPEFCRTLDCSVPGPQVRTQGRTQGRSQAMSQVRCRPRQLELSQTAGCQQALSGPSSHIYMEVDPLYSIMAEPGVVSSSTSSQTSSGYSTAPSNTNNLYELGQDYGHSELAGPGGGVVMFQHLPSHNTKDLPCQGLRTSQRLRETQPELIMNNILLQQTNRQFRL